MAGETRDARVACVGVYSCGKLRTTRRFQHIFHYLDDQAERSHFLPGIPEMKKATLGHQYVLAQCEGLNDAE